MTTLAKRATPAQKMVLRMIDGACRNAASAHPKWNFDPRLAQSIAKRAAGTLTANWPAVLARSQGGSDSGVQGVRDLDAAPEPGLICCPRARSSLRAPWRAPLWSLHRAISREIGRSRRCGDTARADTLIDVARCVKQTIEWEYPRRDRLTIGPSSPPS